MAKKDLVRLQARQAVDAADAAGTARVAIVRANI
jgi:hypothetical protein